MAGTSPTLSTNVTFNRLLKGNLDKLLKAGFTLTLEALIKAQVSGWSDSEGSLQADMIDMMQTLVLKTLVQSQLYSDRV